VALEVGSSVLAHERVSAIVQGGVVHCTDLIPAPRCLDSLTRRETRRARIAPRSPPSKELICEQ
ncbi:hypothetical protein, partial [Chamaesiphon polymorphus]|uniref:hypothetical protein n=1 Tax=Chamaesiphon polymorphus TaxID=2107691 RepID=UPI001C627DA4